MRAVEAVGRDHVGEHLDGVVLDNAQIGEAAFADLFEQAADARRVHFDAEVIVFRMRGGDDGGGFPHAETDFQNLGCAAAVDRIEIDRLRRIRNAVDGQQFGVRALLCVGNAALAQDKAADMAVFDSHRGGSVRANRCRVM